MSANAKIYESYFDHKMDPKYRVSIPVAFRPDTEGEPVRLLSSRLHDLPVIKVFSRDYYQGKFRQIAESDLIPAKKLQLEGSLRMNSKETVINPQGKLTIPKDWSEKIGLKADGPVKLAGRGPFYLICTEENFDRIKEIESALDDEGLGVL